jgi:hypothetical protein
MRQRISDLLNSISSVVVSVEGKSPEFAISSIAIRSSKMMLENG